MPEWGAGGRRFPPFDDRFGAPYEGRGGFDRPHSPPIPRRGAPGVGPPVWDRSDSPGFRGDYDRQGPSGRPWGAGLAGWDAPPERRRGPSADRDGGWGVSASRAPAASAIPLEELSPPRVEPQQPSQPWQAPASASPSEVLPSPPVRGQHRDGLAAQLPDPPRNHSQTNGVHTEAVPGQQLAPKQLPSSVQSGSGRAGAENDAKPQRDGDSRRADGEQAQPQSSAMAQEKDPATARIWFYVDPQV